MEIEDQPWYWGAVDKTVVAQALSKQEDGSFIIKDATAPGNYTLSVRANGVTRLARIIKFGGKYGFVQDDLYESVEALVNYHKDVSLKCYNPELDTCLLTPIPKLPKRNRSSGSWEKNHACKPSVSNPSNDQAWELNLFIENVRAMHTAICRFANVINSSTEEHRRADQLYHYITKNMFELDRKIEEMSKIRENQKTVLNSGTLDERATEAISNNFKILEKSLEKIQYERNKYNDRRMFVISALEISKAHLLEWAKNKKLEEEALQQYLEVLPELDDIADRIKQTTGHATEMLAKEKIEMSKELANMKLDWGPERYLVNECSKDYSEKLLQAAKGRAVKEGMTTDGIFLIRPSASRPNFLVLDVVCGDKIMHILIEQVDLGWGFCKTGTYLVTIGDLVRYYTHESLEAHNPEVKTCLTYPALPVKNVMTSLPSRVRSLVRRRNHDTLIEEEEGWDQREDHPQPQPAAGTSNPAMTNSGEYTELMGESVPCPSCKGTGRIPRAWEETLVALVPFTDDRLQPKKTWLYATIVIVLCLTVASGAIFMLIPRSVVLHPSSDAIEVINVTSWTNNSIEFFFMNSVNITNNNYYPVDVINASVTIIGKQNPYNDRKNGTGGNVSASLWSHEKNHHLVFNNTITITDQQSLLNCQSDWARVLSWAFVYFQFDVSVNISYFNHYETLTTSTIQQVCCIKSGVCKSPDTQE